MNKFDVAELSQTELYQWNELVDHSPHGTIFHKTGWLDACAHAFGKKVKIFGCFQDKNLVGGISLFLDRKMLGLVPVASSTCTMTPFGGFVLSPVSTSSVHKQERFSREVIEPLLKEIKKEHFFSIRIKNSPEFSDVRPFTSHGWKSRVLYAYYINLKDDLESHADPRVKKDIRKAEKNGIIIESFSDISRYYTLFSEMNARKNLKIPASRELFTGVYSFIRDQTCGEMAVAKTPENEIACAEIVVWDNKQAHFWSAVSDPGFLDTGAVNFLRFNSLKRMHERGNLKANMTTANVLKLSQFVTHMNPTLVPYYEIQTGIFNNFSADTE